MDRFADTTRRVDYVAWALRLITWDGALPLLVIFAPVVIEWMQPNRHVGALAFVGIPIAAYFLRLRVGCRHIDANCCSDRVKELQVAAFCFGAFALIFVDTILILMHALPAGGWFATWQESLVLVIPAGIYFSAMVFAMYPGQTPASENSKVRTTVLIRGPK